ncbi:hypothetical protein DEO72_LG3g1690 [Vigna unguiculata]|uniref:Uncharacterized protein n=1 Tax=Vigna unguiculata TaxID=3917 RepID=A0A4D6LFG9_VIGUN|nr:hypothetical protein DEO72_LG3g1690 [Vigna unguiculata]
MHDSTRLKWRNLTKRRKTSKSVLLVLVAPGEIDGLEARSAWRYVSPAKDSGSDNAWRITRGIPRVELGMASLELSSGWRMNTRNP